MGKISCAWLAAVAAVALVVPATASRSAGRLHAGELTPVVAPDGPVPEPKLAVSGWDGPVPEPKLIAASGWDGPVPEPKLAVSGWDGPVPEPKLIAA